MARWPTPDAAIREAVDASPLRARGIDNAHVPTTGEGMALAIEAYSQVHAALGRLRPREREMVIRYALKQSYRDIGTAMGLSKTTVARVHPAARQAIRHRLVTLGLVDP